MCTYKLWNDRNAKFIQRSDRWHISSQFARLQIINNKLHELSARIINRNVTFNCITYRCVVYWMFERGEHRNDCQYHRSDSANWYAYFVNSQRREKYMKNSNELINGRSIGFHYVRTVQCGTYHKTNWHMVQKYRLRFGCPQQHITSQICGKWDPLGWRLQRND